MRSVVYVAGWQRSGTTLVGSILGQLESCFFAGELRFFWRRLARDDRRCGCGARVRDCEVWRGVLRRAFPDGVDAARLDRLGEELLVTRRLPELRRALRGRGRLARDVADYVAALTRLYAGIADETSATIVDTSKSPSYGVLLEAAGVDLRVVHAVRDPRACLHSERRRAQAPPTLQSLLLWGAWNAAIERLWPLPARSARIRYEDLVARPAETLRPVLLLAGAAPSDRPLERTHAVRLSATHSVGGSGSRFRTGIVDLVPDEQWRSGLAPGAKALATAVTAPLLVRYGYPLVPRR